MSDESHAATDEAQDTTEVLDEPSPVEAGETDATAVDPDTAAEGEPLPTAEPEVDAPDAEAEPPPSAEPGDAGSPPEEGAAAADEAARREGQPSPSETDTAEAEPFRYKADGTEFEVPGATVEDGEIRIPREQWQRSIQPQLADRRKIVQERRQLRAEVERASEAHAGELEKWQQIGQAFEELMNAPDEQLVQKIAQLKRAYPKLKLEAERAALEDERKSFTSTREQQQREQQMEQLRPQLRQHLEGAVRQVAEQVAPDVLDDDALGTVSDKLMRLMDAGLFFPADAALAQEMGVPEGTTMVRTDWIEDELRDRAEILSAVQERQKKAEKAREHNRKALGEDGKKPAPTVSAKGSPAPGKKQPNFDEMTREEYDQYMAKEHGIPAI